MTPEILKPSKLKIGRMSTCGAQCPCHINCTSSVVCQEVAGASNLLHHRLQELNELQRAKRIHAYSNPKTLKRKCIGEKKWSFFGEDKAIQLKQRK